MLRKHATMKLNIELEIDELILVKFLFICACVFSVAGVVSVCVLTKINTKLRKHLKIIKYQCIM